MVETFITNDMFGIFLLFSLYRQKGSDVLSSSLILVNRDLTIFSFNCFSSKRSPIPLYSLRSNPIVPVYSSEIRLTENSIIRGENRRDSGGVGYSKRFGSSRRMATTTITESVVANECGGRKREEIFVDIIENLSVTFSSSGSILTSEINGSIQLKNHLTGNPNIRIALNELVSIGKDGGSTFDYGSSRIRPVILDDCNFHESVRLDNFDVDRTLTLGSTAGEFPHFPVMNYRITQEFKPPFRINVSIEESGPLEAEVTIKVHAEFSSSFAADKIIVQLPVPPYTTMVSFELEPGAVGNTTDLEANKRIEWGLKKIVGGSEHTLLAKLTFAQELHGNITKEAGPVSMTFTIPNYNATRLQINYVYISKTSKSSNPYRRVRYVTQSNSYVARL